MRFIRLVVAILALSLSASATNAAAHHIPHPAWSKLDLAHRAKVLKRIVAHDRAVLGFFKDNPRLLASERTVLVAKKQIKWHRVSLRIASKNLRKIERQLRFNGGGSVPAIWQALCICEQSGNWHVHGSAFAGGLGFATATWAQFRYPGMPYSAGDASPFQQIAVARRLMRLYGGTPWTGNCNSPAWAIVRAEGL